MSIQQIFKRAARNSDTVRVGPHGWPVPKSVAHKCTPTSVLATIHGLEVGETHCPCGHPTEAASSCPACGRPYQTRCGTDGCDAWVQPEAKTDTGWYPPPSMCPKCIEDTERSLRLSRLKHIPSQIRQDASTYEQRENRASLDAHLHEWLKGDMRSGFWITGKRKTGKSTAAARAAIKAIFRGSAETMMWLECEDLVAAAKRCYQDDSAAQWRLIDKSHRTDLLVLDDVFPNTRTRPDGKVLAVEGISAHACHTLGELFRKRLMADKPTIITSVHTAQNALAFLGDNALSWWGRDSVQGFINE